MTDTDRSLARLRALVDDDLAELRAAVGALPRPLLEGGLVDLLVQEAVHRAVEDLRGDS